MNIEIVILFFEEPIGSFQNQILVAKIDNSTILTYFNDILILTFLHNPSK